jgi:hypothetical protein
MTIAKIASSAHQPIKMEYNTVYTSTIENYIIGSITEEQSINYWKDGRHSGEWMEMEICNRHTNLIHVLGQKTYDATIEGGNIPLDGVTKVEIRTYTAGGTQLLASGDIGSGRSADDTKFMLKINSTDFLICDIRNFPKVEYALMSGKALQSVYDKKITNPKKIVKTMESIVESIMGV